MLNSALLVGLTLQHPPRALLTGNLGAFSQLHFLQSHLQVTPHPHSLLAKWRAPKGLLIPAAKKKSLSPAHGGSCGSQLCHCPRGTFAAPQCCLPPALLPAQHQVKPPWLPAGRGCWRAPSQARIKCCSVPHASFAEPAAGWEPAWKAAIANSDLGSHDKCGWTAAGNELTIDTLASRVSM